jgi:hypothetical protein
MSNWRARRNLVFGFVITMALQLAGSQIVLPGWLRMFAGAIRQYREYTQSQSVLEVILNQIFGSTVKGSAAHVCAEILGFIAVMGCLPLLWKLRVEPCGKPAFAYATALVMAVTVLVVPMYAPYNQVLLLPSILVLVQRRAAFIAGASVRRFAYLFAGLTLGWQWLASFGLTAAYFLISPAAALERWQWPFFATFAIPVWIFVLNYFCAKDLRDRPNEVLSKSLV